MDLWHILTLVALVGLSLSVFRESARHGDFGQLARLERKVDLIMRHLGWKLTSEWRCRRMCMSWLTAGRRLRPFGNFARATSG